MKTKYVVYIIGLKSMFVERGYSDKSELIKIEEKAHVQELELIAAGESSDVFSGLTTHEEKEKKIAIKVYKGNNNPPNVLSHLVGRKMNHIVQILEVSTFQPAFLLMELCERDVKSFVTNLEGDKTQQILRISQEIAKGLSSLKFLRLMHGDLKPSNILIDFQRNIKLSDLDFVLRQEQFQSKSIRVGTLTYMAPEILKEWKSSYMSDIWSLGVVIFELLTGERPFTELQRLDHSQESSLLDAYSIIKHRLEQIRLSLKQKMLQPQSHASSILVECIFKCLAWQPKDRITLEEFLELLEGSLRPRKLSYSTEYSSFHHQDDIFMYPNTGLLLALQQLQNILYVLPQEAAKFNDVMNCTKRILETPQNNVNELITLEQMLHAKYKKMERNFKRLSNKEGGIDFSNRGKLFNHLKYLISLLSEMKENEDWVNRHTVRSAQLLS